jgi:hypothetical protein
MSSARAYADLGRAFDRRQRPRIRPAEFSNSTGSSGCQHGHPCPPQERVPPSHAWICARCSISVNRRNSSRPNFRTARVGSNRRIRQSDSSEISSANAGLDRHRAFHWRQPPTIKPVEFSLSTRSLRPGAAESNRHSRQSDSSGTGFAVASLDLRWAFYRRQPPKCRPAEFSNSAESIPCVRGSTRVGVPDVRGDPKNGRSRDRRNFQCDHQHRCPGQPGPEYCLDPSDRTGSNRPNPEPKSHIRGQHQGLRASDCTPTLYMTTTRANISRH